MSDGTAGHGLDPRAWLLWGAAVSLPLLTGRHPVVLATLIVVVFTVRATCLPRSVAAGWGWLLSIALVAVPVGLVFNALTVHAGEHVLFRIPDIVPFAGGTVTLNAVVYGALSGLTVVVLVASGVTVAAALDWSALMRLVPARAANVAVAGSVAWAFLPQLAVSWREIREAQAARGHRVRGARAMAPLVVPLLAGGLERSVTMAEVLETRGFGAVGAAPRRRTWASAALAVAMTAAVLAVYLVSVGRVGEAGLAALSALAISVAGVRAGSIRHQQRQTRYRPARWRARDWGASVGAAVAAMATVAALQIEPAALRYDPYPTLEVPDASVWLVLGLAMLMIPAVLAPAAGEQEERP